MIFFISLGYASAQFSALLLVFFVFLYNSVNWAIVVAAELLRFNITIPHIRATGVSFHGTFFTMLTTG